MIARTRAANRSWTEKLLAAFLFSFSCPHLHRSQPMVNYLSPSTLAGPPDVLLVYPLEARLRKDRATSFDATRALLVRATLWTQLSRTHTRRVWQHPIFEDLRQN